MPFPRSDLRSLCSQIRRCCSRCCYRQLRPMVLLQGKEGRTFLLMNSQVDPRFSKTFVVKKRAMTATVNIVKNFDERCVAHDVAEDRQAAMSGDGKEEGKKDIHHNAREVRTRKPVCSSACCEVVRAHPRINLLKFSRQLSFGKSVGPVGLLFNKRTKSS